MPQKTITYTPVNGLHDQILKLCHRMELPLHYNCKGPKTFTNYQRIGLIVLFLRSKKALRDFIAELYESRWPRWLGLREIPGKTTLHDWIALFSTPIVRTLNALLLEEEEPQTMAVDGTGIDSWQRSRHYAKRIGEPPMPYAKLDVLIDTGTLFIHDFLLTMKPRHDVVAARSFFTKLQRKDRLILADKGYDSEPLHRVANDNGNTLFAPIRDFKVKRPKGRHRRRCARGNAQYSRRNTVESVIHALKSNIGALQSRLHYMKKREMAWHVLVYNLEKMSRTAQRLIDLLLSYLFRTRPFSS